MIHAMIDLETLSTKPNATILTIGGVKFNPYNNIEPSQGLYHRIDVDSQSAMGRDIDPDTVEWWGKQAEDVREEALGDHDRIDLKYFIKPNKDDWKNILTTNITAQIVFCRLHYWRVPKKLPKTIDEQALYWKRYYNTEKGAGTIKHFKDIIND